MSFRVLVYRLFVFFVVYLSSPRWIASSDVSKKPHIILITADDMGWNDVSFHGSNVIKTPNIDALAYHGVILNDFHTSSLCTPSRSALMTGEYPIHTGTQHSVILEAEPTGLPLDRKILPEFMKDAGYSTHLIGKWHLGFYKEVYTPTKRGFDSFYGYWQGHQDYFSHYAEETFGPFIGYDMRNDLKTDWKTEGQYSTDVFTGKAVDLIEKHNAEKPLFLYLSQIAPHAGAKNDPLQAPEEEIKKFSHIPNLEKRKYAAMVSKLDESVGKVVKALKNKNMLENSVILFMSDNGAPTVGIYATTGSNYPFRGIKSTEWEGGTRVPAIVWSPLFTRQQRVSNMMMHMVDILPTLCKAAGLNLEDVGEIDGKNMWENLVNGSEESPRTEFVYNIDPAHESNAYGAIRLGDWKYIQGTKNTTGPENDWYNIFNLEAVFDDTFYDTADIINSSVAKAISTLTLPLHNTDYDHKHIDIRRIDLSNEVDKELESNIDEILTPEKILSLREEARIDCSRALHRPPCMLNEAPCLINLLEDPCERYNLADENPLQMEIMRGLFEKYRQEVIPPMNKPRDEDADPTNYNGVWVNWGDSQSSTFPFYRRITRRAKQLRKRLSSTMQCTHCESEKEKCTMLE